MYRCYPAAGCSSDCFGARPDLHIVSQFADLHDQPVRLHLSQSAVEVIRTQLVHTSRQWTPVASVVTWVQRCRPAAQGGVL